VEGVGKEAEVGEEVVEVQALLLACWIDLPCGREPRRSMGSLVLLPTTILLLDFTR
jgi:hypothetical protein